MTTGEKIKYLRMQKRLTQKEVASRCGIADSAIRKYESGKVTPKLETIQKIATALNVPFISLLDNDNDIGAALVHKIEQRADELRQQNIGNGRAILSQEELDRLISAAEQEHIAFLETLCFDPSILDEDYPDRIRYVTSFIKKNADMLKLAMPGRNLHPDDIEELKKIRAAGGIPNSSK